MSRRSPPSSAQVKTIVILGALVVLAVWGYNVGWFGSSAGGSSAKVVEADRLWGMATRSFHRDGFGPSAGCPWMYRVDPEFTYMIEQGINIDRRKPREYRPIWDSPSLPLRSVSLGMGCRDRSKGLGLEFWMQVVGVAPARARLHEGKVPLLLDHTGPPPPSGGLPQGPTGAVAVPALVDGTTGRFITLIPTDEMIRGFQGAWTMMAFIPLDDGSVVVATFDLTHSTAHSEAIVDHCTNN